MGPRMRDEGKVSRDRQKHGHEEAEAEKARKGHGRGNRDSKGRHGRGQVNRPRPHVSMKETRKMRKIWKSANTGGILVLDQEGRVREQAEGTARRARATFSRKGNRSSGAHRPRERGERAAWKHREEKTRGRGKEKKGGDESDAPRDSGDEKRGRKKGKRLGRSLRTHPQPGSTTLSVLMEGLTSLTNEEVVVESKPYYFLFSS